MFTLRAHRVFAFTLIVLSLVTGTLQYVGNPIKCFTPGEFSYSHTDYAKSSCYFSPTYYLRQFDTDDFVPKYGFVNYYKFMPFIFAFFGVFYLGPEILTNFGCKLVLFNISSLLEVTRQSHQGPRESRKAAIEQLVVDLQHRVSDKVTRHKRTDFRRWIDKIIPSLPFYIQLQHFSSKLAFAVGSILPLVLLRTYISVNFGFHDQVMTSNYNVSNQNLFPKVIQCDFEVVRLGNMQRYTVQCELPANDMFEKMSLFVYFLAIVVCTIDVSDVISCVTFPLFAPWDYPYIKRHMKVFTNINTGYEKELLRDFVERYLKSDVIYLLQLIGQNSSEHVVCQILARLWEGYLFSDNNTRSSSQDEKTVLELQEHCPEGNTA